MFARCGWAVTVGSFLHSLGAHVQGSQALGIPLPELRAVDHARGAQHAPDPPDAGYGALSLLRPLLLHRESPQVVCSRSFSRTSSRHSEPPLVDDLEYAVYQRWFEWLMEYSAPQLDLIGKSISITMYELTSTPSLPAQLARGVPRSPPPAWPKRGVAGPAGNGVNMMVAFPHHIISPVVSPDSARSI